MATWAVWVKTALADPLTDEHLGQLVDALDQYAASVSRPDDTSVACQLTVQADTLPEAVTTGIAAVTDALAAVRASTGTITGLEVLPWREFADRVDRPEEKVPLINRKGIEERLGISHTQVQRIVSRADFPNVYCPLPGRGTEVWDLREVEPYLARLNRTPGRPPIKRKKEPVG